MSNDKLNIKIRPLGLLDLLAFKKLIPSRKEKINAAPASPVTGIPPMNRLASQIHPALLHLVIESVTDETSSSRTYRLTYDKDSETNELAVFRPGQYLSFLFDIEGAYVTRPYSISSSPKEALSGYYEITVKKNEGGFVTNYIWDNWTEGAKVTSRGPEGHFYYEPLRDLRKIIGIAGGCGITPFRSMMKSILDGSLDAELTLFYGCNKKDEIIFLDEFKGYEESAAGKIKIINVLAGEKGEGFEEGFITPELIKKYADIDNSSFFICGPQAMYDFLDRELSVLNLRKKFVRKELFGEIRNVAKYPGFPGDKAGQTFRMLVHMGKEVNEIPASSCESLLVAMERAKLRPPSGCRSGACGLCRSLLVKGDVFIPENDDGRRQADKLLGYIHPCSSFPISDTEIIVPRAK